jgi:hypothetical protein
MNKIEIKLADPATSMLKKGRSKLFHLLTAKFRGRATSLRLSCSDDILKAMVEKK